MGRRSKNPLTIVAPVSSKAQLMGITDVCKFLGGISRDSLSQMRGDPDLKFPPPLQLLGNTPQWSVEQLEKFVARQTKAVEALSA